MDIKDIIKQFRNIERPSSNDDVLPVVSIGGMLHKLSVSPEGFPRFFVATSTTFSPSQNIIRELLSVEYNLECTISKDDGAKEDNIFTVITLRTPEHALQDYFIEIVVMMLEKFQKEPTCHEVAVEVENLISIFSALNNPPRKKIQGLWTELLVIDQASFPNTLITAWHNDPTAKYDFTLGRDKIEVKSTASEKRVHHFSYDQLNPSVHSQLLIASAIVRESGENENGLSIYDLYEKIYKRLHVTDYRLKLYKVIAETVGSDVVKLKEVHFDYIQAVDSLKFYDARKVPHINEEGIPAHVSEVKFASDLSDVEDVLSGDSDFDYSKSPLYKSLFTPKNEES